MDNVGILDAAGIICTNNDLSWMTWPRITHSRTFFASILSCAKLGTLHGTARRKETATLLLARPQEREVSITFRNLRRRHSDPCSWGLLFHFWIRPFDLKVAPRLGSAAGRKLRPGGAGAGGTGRRVFEAWFNWKEKGTNPFGHGSKLRRQGSAGFSPCFHLPGQPILRLPYF